jgi:hypothetical protein
MKGSGETTGKLDARRTNQTFTISLKLTVSLYRLDSSIESSFIGDTVR